MVQAVQQLAIMLPQFDRSVIAGRGNELVIRGETNAIDCIFMLCKTVTLLYAINRICEYFLRLLADFLWQIFDQSCLFSALLSLGVEDNELKPLKARIRI
jgi:hypothetical protein